MMQEVNEVQKHRLLQSVWHDAEGCAMYAQNHTSLIQHLSDHVLWGVHLDITKHDPTDVILCPNHL